PREEPGDPRAGGRLVQRRSRLRRELWRRARHRLILPAPIDGRWRLRDRPGRHPRRLREGEDRRDDRRAREGARHREGSARLTTPARDQTAPGSRLRISVWARLIECTSTVSMCTAVSVSWSASARASLAAWI